MNLQHNVTTSSAFEGCFMFFCTSSYDYKNVYKLDRKTNFYLVCFEIVSEREIVRERVRVCV